MRAPAIASALSVCILLTACGGGGGLVSTDSTFKIRWGERTRGSVNAPSSALSARVTFPGGGASGNDLVLNVERNSDPAAYTGTYHVGAVIPATVNRFEVEFFAQTGQAGSIVATANADVTWQGTQASFGEVLTEGKVASVTVVDPGDVSEVDPQFELEYVAKDADGASIALSPGSANWTLLSGNSSMSVTRDGLATPLLPGDVSIKVSVDGVSSPAITISLSKAEITAKYLGPEWSSALVLGGDGFVQGGSLNDLPCLWRGTNESHVNLKPADAISGKVLATNSDVQVGHIYIASSIHERGGLWTGSAASFVDLTPVSPRFALGSNATCAANGRQGGYAIFSHPLTQLIIFPEPGYWSGTASSWTNLLPSGFVLGAVFGISASNECGEVRDDSGNGKKAALWSGTAASFKSLHPSSASESVAYGLNADYQVGSATFGSNPRAYAWRGTPGSAIDLHGSLGRSSEARVVVDQFAAGHVDSIGTIWNIPSRRALKLDSVLPSGFSQSEIYGGAKTSTGYDFVGYVSNPNSGVSLGVVWHVPFRRMPQ